MMNRQRQNVRLTPADPRAALTWLGAAIVVGCGMWLAWLGGPARYRAWQRAAAADPVVDEVRWIDRRLAAEQAAGPIDSARRECRLAALHWDRATRLAQHAYYRRYGMVWRTDVEDDYGPFCRDCLRQDGSRDVAATRAAARRALALLPAGQRRVRPLWFLSQSCSADGEWDEAIGALIEVTRYAPRDTWVWQQLATAYELRRDFARQELAAEQGWRTERGSAPSSYITAVIRGTPYARLPLRRASDSAK